MNPNPFFHWRAAAYAQRESDGRTYERLAFGLSGYPNSRSDRASGKRSGSLGGNGGASCGDGGDAPGSPTRLAHGPNYESSAPRTYGRASTTYRAPARFMEWGGRMEAR